MLAVSGCRVEYTASASQTIFPYPFKIFEASDLTVIVDGEELDTSAYSVTGAGEAAGGNVVLVTAASGDEEIIITAEAAYTQALHYEEGDAFPASSHEEGLDRLTRLAQQLKEITDRCLQLNIAHSFGRTGLELPDPSGMTLSDPDNALALVWNSDLTNLTLAELATETGLLSSQVGTSTRAGLPGGAAQGSFRKVTDSVGGVWQKGAVQWYSLMGEMMDAKEKGCLCNGVADDGAIINTIQSLTTTPVIIFPPGTYLFTASRTITGGVTLWLLPGAILSVASGQTLTINGQIWAGDEQHFAGDGSVTIHHKNVLNPVWWTTSGDGTSASPWTSTDGTCGHQKMFNALQQYGKTRGPSGEYRWTGTASVNLDNIECEWAAYAHHVMTADVVLMNFNSGADPSDTSTNNHTITVRGGFWDTGSENTALLSTVFKFPRCRNITIEKCRFRRVQTALWLGSADTMRVHGNFFRTCRRAVHFPDYLNMEGVTPQDIWVQYNSFSGEADELMQCVVADSVISAIHIEYNGAAIGYGQEADQELGKFVDLVTGALDNEQILDPVTYPDPDLYESSNIHIVGNATEQAWDPDVPDASQTLVRIWDTGVEADCSDVYIKENDFGSAFVTILDLNRTRGVWHIVGNQFQHGGARAIKLDIVRPDSVVIIDGNKFLQDEDDDGINWEITNVQQTGQVFIGRNSFPAHEGNIGTMTHPVLSGRVVFAPLTPALNMVTADTEISFRPWISMITLTAGSATNVDGFAITWEGHRIIVKLAANVTLRQTGGGNLRLHGDVDIVGSTSPPKYLEFYCSGTQWLQLYQPVTHV